MKFKFAYHITSEVNMGSMQELSELLELFLKDKSYGHDILSYYIGITSVDPKFDGFFKPRKPKYTGEKKSYTKDGIKFEIEKTFEHGIKLDYEFYLNSDKGAIQKEVSLRVLESINDLKKAKRFKALDFDFEAFHDDLKGVMKSKGLI